MSDLFLKDLPPCPLCGSDEYEGQGINLQFIGDGLVLRIEFGCECGLRMVRYFTDERDDGGKPYSLNLEITRRHIEEMIADFWKIAKKEGAAHA